MASELKFEDGSVAQVTKWLTQSSTDKGITKYFVGIDIGGTNTRFTIGTANEAVTITKFHASSVKIIVSQLHTIAKSEPFSKIIASGAALAVAGRILGDYASITNFPGGKEDQELHLAALPENLFPKSKTRFLNDLESACHGISFLNNSNTLSEYFKLLWPTKSFHKDAPPTLKPGQNLVLAIGTGLGVGLLHSSYNAPTNVFEVLPMEFGHTLITPLGTAHPNHNEEADLLAYISKKLYDSKHTPEYEDICSGRGLIYCYEWVIKDAKDAPQNLSAADIATNAGKGDKYASKALELHYRYAARCSQGLAIGLQCKVIFFAGDNQVHNQEFIFKRIELLKQEFLNHTKSSWLDDIPIYAQTKVTNINILGALHVARSYSH